MFSRVAIVNRGEAAMRVIRAAREVGVEQGSPLTTIALYTDVERDSMFVREADEAVRIYSAGRDAYLDYEVLERAFRRRAPGLLAASQGRADATACGTATRREWPRTASRRSWPSSGLATLRQRAGIHPHSPVPLLDRLLTPSRADRAIVGGTS
jgi:hypothetical protein